MYSNKFRSKIKTILSDLFSDDNISFELEPLYGGSINYTYKIFSKYAVLFLKLNYDNIKDDFFFVEEKGIKLLGNVDGVKVPKVIYRSHNMLLMNFIHHESLDNFSWQNLASDIAKIHSVKHNFFGLDYDNYIGSLCQKNTLDHNWINFFIEKRIKPQIIMSQLPKDILILFDLLFSKLDSILIEEDPSLLHGDFWSGNFLIQDDKPVFIDPAVYFGSREMDLAMSKLFGGFHTDFYNIYNEIYPLRKNWEERLEIYTLYPLLVHHNIFGGNYHLKILKILKSFV